MFGKPAEYQCVQNIESVSHVILECELRRDLRSEWPKGWKNKDSKELVPIHEFRSQTSAIVKALYETRSIYCPFNTVFQAELLAIKEACLWASKTNQQIKVWSDSESSLHSIASIDTKSPIAQQTQEILLKSTNIKLGWIKAHVGYSGNEAADVQAKKATQEGIPTFIPAPRNHIKSLLQKESITRWQKEWDNGETGRSVHNVLPKVKATSTPWQRPEIMFVTGHCPFPTYLKRFNIRSSDSCGCGKLGNPLRYATSCLFTTSYHLTKPSADLEPLWWKRVMNNNNSRAKIKKLMHFIAENEPLLFPKDGDDN
ncbi:hypothetical protein AVEN_47973-1 [Araneus ventricosus]|uniref:RNase H type-1 domain-containing protein n=1 Tax=Araneus ventricosus TaxID=182803 RepID=A0A4Y2JTJ1_ARAVE|nr:hypothetical protein AVEN_47973-1 [Araneus ventricosus]